MFLTVCANPSVDSFWRIDTLTPGTTNRSKGESFYPGGKGIHTAFALGELGQKVTTLGVWGGQTGQWLQQQCKKNGISTVGPTVEGWTRLCMTIQSDTKWKETEVLGRGPVVSDMVTNSFQSAFQQCLTERKPEAMLISGSTPDGFDDRLYHTLVEEARGANVPAYVDASGPLLTHALEAHPYGVHINLQEGQDLCGRNTPVEIAQWLSQKCTLAAVTAGADGLYLGFEGTIYHACYTIDESEIISTIGSGDCLLAGLSLAANRFNEPEQWTRYAAACGSANCIHPELGMLQRSDVERIFEQVMLKKL